MRHADARPKLVPVRQGATIPRGYFRYLILTSRRGRGVYEWREGIHWCVMESRGYYDEVRKGKPAKRIAYGCLFFFDAEWMCCRVVFTGSEGFRVFALPALPTRPPPSFLVSVCGHKKSDSPLRSIFFSCRNRGGEERAGYSSLYIRREG